MKLSDYNVFIPWGKNDEFIIFNTLTAAEVKINMEIKDILDDFKSNGQKLDKKHLEIFARNGIIIDDDVDEKKIIKVARDDARFHNTDIRFTVVTTYACNLSCVYCFEGKGEILNEKMNEKNAEASINFVKSMVEKYNRKALFLTLYGGEPFLNLDICLKFLKNFSSWCKDVGVTLNCNVFTNGTLLSQDLIDKINSYETTPRIQVSLHGPKRIHDTKRVFKNGKGSYDLIIEGIQRVRDAKLPFYIAEMIDKDNIDFQEEFLDDLIEKDLRNTSVRNPSIGFDIIDSATEYCNSYSAFCLPEFGAEKYLINLKRLAIKKGFLIFNDLILNPMFCAAESKFCFIIDPFLDLYKCPSFLGDKRHSVGSINERGGIEKINYALHDFMSRDPLTFKKCGDCKYLPMCGGGCTNKAFFKHGTYHKESCTSIRGVDQRIKLYLEEKLKNQQC